MSDFWVVELTALSDPLAAFKGPYL